MRRQVLKNCTDVPFTGDKKADAKLHTLSLYIHILCRKLWLSSKSLASGSSASRANAIKVKKKANLQTPKKKRTSEDRSLQEAGRFAKANK